MLGTNSLGIAHTVRDVVLTKVFWRKHLDVANAFVPPELA